MTDFEENERKLDMQSTVLTEQPYRCAGGNQWKNGFITNAMLFY
jgi:hypothetical protein